MFGAVFSKYDLVKRLFYLITATGIKYRVLVTSVDLLIPLRPISKCFYKSLFEFFGSWYEKVVVCCFNVSSV